MQTSSFLVVFISGAKEQIFCLTLLQNNGKNMPLSRSSTNILSYYEGIQDSVPLKATSILTRMMECIHMRHNMTG